MKNWKKCVVFVLTLSMVAMSLAACGKKDNAGDSSNTPTSGAATTATTETETETEVTTAAVEDVTLKVWAPEEDQDVTTKLCNNFAAAHPEYNITWTFEIMNSDGTVLEALKKDLDVAGDVFSFPSGATPDLVQAGIIYPLTVDADAVISSNGATALKACSVDDQLYAVPQSPNSFFMFYNKSMYSEADVQNLDTMLAKDLGAGVQNFSMAVSNSWFIESFFYALGSTLYGADGMDATNCSWNDANGLKAANYLIGLANNPKYVENMDGVGDAKFKEGTLGASCSGMWSYNDYKAALGDNLGAAQLPTITVDGTNYQLSNFADFRAIGVKSNTAFPKAAQQLAAFLGNEQSQLEFFKSNSICPTITNLATNPEVMANVAATALIKQATQFSTPQPSIPQVSQYWTPAQAFGTSVINKETTAANLQENLDLMVQGILAPPVAE